MKNKRILGTVIIIIILILAGAFSFFYFKSSGSLSQSEPGSVSGTQDESGSTEEENSQAQSQSDTLPAPEELFKKAVSFYQEKKYSDAENTYKQILAQEPENIEALLGLGNAYRDWGKTDLAIAQYEKVIEMDQHNITAYLNLTQIYKDKDQKDKAKEVLEDGLKHNPGNSDLQNTLDILDIMPHSEEGVG